MAQENLQALFLKVLLRPLLMVSKNGDPNQRGRPFVSLQKPFQLVLVKPNWFQD